MKGIKLGIVGLCVSLLGIAVATNNVGAIAAAFFGMILSVCGCFIRE